MKVRLSYITAPILIFFLSCIAITAFAQKDQVEGNWYTEGKESKVNIYKGVDGKFYGKIVCLKEPDTDGKPKTDIYNQNASLKTRPILGLDFLKGFVKNGDVYKKGIIYNPKDGKTYSCKMTYKGNQLYVRGFIGVSMIGKSTVFTKAD